MGSSKEHIIARKMQCVCVCVCLRVYVCLFTCAQCSRERCVSECVSLCVSLCVCSYAQVCVLSGAYDAVRATATAAGMPKEGADLVLLNLLDESECHTRPCLLAQRGMHACVHGQTCILLCGAWRD